jgi:hypothetical protein
MKKISNFMIFSMFLTVVGATPMSMTSHTIKADDAKENKGMRLLGGLAAGAATVAAGAAAYKYRKNIGNTFNQMRGKPTTAKTTDTATAKPAQTKDTQTKTTSPERRDAIKQVKTENKPMETKPETATNPVAAPIAPKTEAPAPAPDVKAPPFKPDHPGQKSPEVQAEIDARRARMAAKKTGGVNNQEAPAPAPEAPAQSKSLAEQLQEAQAKLKTVDQKEIAAGNAAAAEKKRAAELRKETPEMKNLRQNIEARQKQAAEAEAAKALRKAEKEKAKAAAAEAAAAAAK